MGNTKGICYGVSAGPGDPELLTLKAVKIIKSSDVIFLPSAPKETCKVYKIIKDALPDIDEEKFFCVGTKGMTNPKNQGERYDILADEVAKLLDSGKQVAFPALGEVCLYSTYFYVHERLSKRGYTLKLVSGISSVQETADRVMISLAQGDEQVHIFPDTDDLKMRLMMPGTKVFMKPKSNLSETVERIQEYCSMNPDVEAYGISNCGNENETVAAGWEELNKLCGYMTVIIVRQK